MPKAVIMHAVGQNPAKLVDMVHDLSLLIIERNSHSHIFIPSPTRDALNLTFFRSAVDFFSSFNLVKFKSKQVHLSLKKAYKPTPLTSTQW